MHERQKDTLAVIVFVAGLTLAAAVALYQLYGGAE